MVVLLNLIYCWLLLKQSQHTAAHPSFDAYQLYTGQRAAILAPLPKVAITLWNNKVNKEFHSEIRFYACCRLSPSHIVSLSGIFSDLRRQTHPTKQLITLQWQYVLFISCLYGLLYKMSNLLWSSKSCWWKKEARN